MVNFTKSSTNKSANSQLLSDLLDDQCISDDFEKLLESTDTVNDWYRYHTVSAILRSEDHVQATQSFCQQVSAKIADEPTIIGAPMVNHQAQDNDDVRTATVTPIRRFGGGLAIAASAAFATFFSVQILQVSENILPDGSNQQSVASNINGDNSIPKIAVEIADSLEQTELELFSDSFKGEAWNSGNIAKQQVSGAYVKTIRFSAEDWQKMLDRAVRLKTEKEAAAKLDNNSVETETTHIN